ncbi:hypothetical protein H4R33_002850 [Dimargaris cristalligena]|uniref:Cofactor of BRCA1-domain-containing protein n=1 Tax=Dimargaris cristalligena TaxID=215637 RepID=A0A4P9ZYJ0_9FUNG|nr:hypothetical protein H4R33_002850 [Dimargaris cristalligena]RKP38796.1 cofactor of BRCA1-domain-containing protein [Dimargaris cristalligena]|eukprot:RKP38796.1 cofactor of BRCA1-domain-containing protein [Dimargaris cristalligena]
MDSQPPKYLLATDGRDHIKKALSVSDPKRVISDVQQKFGFHKPQVEAAYPILDTSGCSRRLVHTSCLDALKKAIMAKIEAGLTKEQFDKLLEQTLPYLHIPQLRDIPLRLLKSQPERITPDATQTIVSLPELFDVCPVEVKRYMWTTEPSLFHAFVTPLLEVYRNDPSLKTLGRELRPTDVPSIIQQRRNHPSVVTLAGAIHTNISLYNTVLGVLRQGFVQTGDKAYCNLRFDLLMKMHENDIREIYDKDPCYLLVWYLDACFRNQVMDERRVNDIKKFFNTVDQNGPVYGEIGMILYSDCVCQTFSLQLLSILIQDVANFVSPKADQNLIWAATMVKLGTRAKLMIETRDFKVHKIDKEIIQNFMVNLSQIIGANQARLKEVYQALSNALDHDVTGQFDYWSDEEAEEIMQESYRSQVNTVALIEEISKLVVTHEIALQIFGQYVLDRLLRLDLHALMQALPVFQVYLNNAVSSTSLSGSPPSTQAVDAFYQSYVSCIISEIRPLYAEILKHSRLHEVLITGFLIASVPQSRFAFLQVLRLCQFLQTRLLSAHSNLNDSLSAENRLDAFRLLAGWADAACTAATAAMHTPGAAVYTAEPDAELFAACQTLIQKSPAAAGAYQIVPRHFPRIKEFMDSVAPKN